MQGFEEKSTFSKNFKMLSCETLMNALAVALEEN